MKKLPLIAAIAGSTLAANAFAIPYTITGTAGAITVDAVVTPTLIYSAPSANPPISGDWDFTFNGSTVDFTGQVFLGDYSTYTQASAFGSTMTGTLSYYGAMHTVSGTGNWNAATKTFTYSVMGGSSSNGASVYSESSASTCTGSGSIFGATVCGTASSVNPAWEGLELNFVFSNNLDTFTGSIVGISQSGSSISQNTTSFNYSVGGEVVPVPAAAWLFGSALLGLTGVARRKRA